VFHKNDTNCHLFSKIYITIHLQAGKKQFDRLLWSVSVISIKGEGRNERARTIQNHVEKHY